MRRKCCCATAGGECPRQYSSAFNLMSGFDPDIVTLDATQPPFLWPYTFYYPLNGVFFQGGERFYLAPGSSAIHAPNDYFRLITDDFFNDPVTDETQFGYNFVRHVSVDAFSALDPNHFEQLDLTWQIDHQALVEPSNVELFAAIANTHSVTGVSFSVYGMRLYSDGWPNYYLIEPWDDLPTDRRLECRRAGEDLSSPSSELVPVFAPFRWDRDAVVHAESSISASTRHIMTIRLQQDAATLQADFLLNGVVKYQLVDPHIPFPTPTSHTIENTCWLIWGCRRRALSPISVPYPGGYYDVYGGRVSVLGTGQSAGRAFEVQFEEQF